jgi:hypothetical protein
MRKTPASRIAFGGMMAALALVIMNLGGLIPVATYVCPMLCMMVLSFVAKMCGSRIGWAWYGAVAILSLLLSPDKEAAAVFVFLGFYPLVKPKLDGRKLSWFWKLLLFNADILLLYALLIHILGLNQISAEFQDMGLILTGVMLFLGNVTFILLDRVLTRLSKMK